MTKIKPPEIFGAEWQVAFNPDVLWADYAGQLSTACRLRPLPVGMSVELVRYATHPDFPDSYHGSTAVAFRPALADQAELANWAREIVPLVQEFDHACRKRNFHKCGKQHTDAVAEARQVAGEMLARWGLFTHRSNRVREILAIEFIMPKELRELQRLIKATKAKAAATLIERKDSAGEGVDWSDEDVVAALIQLTMADADHAVLVNGKGWGRGYASLGHWCYGMLKTDRDLAIRVARTIVGEYGRQFQPSGRRAA